jgi:hypothetical protein
MMARDIEGELNHLDKMMTSLVELLEEKGIITQAEWETRIRQKVEGSKDLTRFEDLKD